ncbi:hypothetical protein GJ496_000626 [Pomphorhynchus laevis]|nr:hypothetical protein GJ496_000626 [Pomphorhynchus laevis]
MSKPALVKIDSTKSISRHSKLISLNTNEQVLADNGITGNDDQRKSRLIREEQNADVDVKKSTSLIEDHDDNLGSISSFYFEGDKLLNEITDDVGNTDDDGDGEALIYNLYRLRKVLWILACSRKGSPIYQFGLTTDKASEIVRNVRLYMVGITGIAKTLLGRTFNVLQIPLEDGSEILVVRHVRYVIIVQLKKVLPSGKCDAEPTKELRVKPLRIFEDK